MYTYDDYRKKLADSGLTMSDADARIAEQNPDAGMSLITYKQDYDGAATESARALAHANAEAIRRQYGGYSGGADGAGYALVTDNPQYSSKWDEKIAGEFDQLGNRFSYDPNTDELTRYYTKQYQRLGDQAFDQTLGELAARTGGQASSYAASAAAQARNSYMQQLTDKYEDLYNDAYNRFLDEYSRHATNAQLYQNQDNVEYTRFLDQKASEQQQRQMRAAADQQAFENSMAEKQLAMNERELDADIDYRLKALDIDQQNTVKELAYKYAALAQSGRQADADLAYKYAALSADQKNLVENLAYKYAALDYQKSQDAIDNDYRTKALDAEIAAAGKTTSEKIDWGSIDKRIAYAEWAAEMGDYSKLEELGIDPQLYYDYVSGKAAAAPGTDQEFADWLKEQRDYYAGERSKVPDSFIHGN